MTRGTVSILLPSYATRPSGGHKVQYLYAEGLARAGFDVTVWHPRTAAGPAGALDTAKSFLWPAAARRRHGPVPPWHPLDPAVKTRLARGLSQRQIRDADVVIVTGWQAAEQVLRWEHPRVLYVIYDYEYWHQADHTVRSRIERTFSDRLVLVSTSQVVSRMVAGSGSHPDATISCGVDLAAFGVDVAPRDRDAQTIAFPARPEPWKGTDDAIAAAGLLRDRLGAVRTIAFGYQPPETVPDWIDVRVSPSDRELREIYNTASVFLFPSRLEGWGLPGLEAQACGACLVTTASGGVDDYARDGETAVVVPPGDPAALAQAAERLIRDDERRIQMAEAGIASAGAHGTSQAVEKLIDLVETTLATEDTGARA
jgi:glycosyltransferase involved in cell wall biosynthesis